MIRRKLTRIEVTLDDTKDLDEYFSKASSNLVAISNQVGATGTTTTTPACSSKIPSQLYQLYTKHYSSGTGTNQTNLDLSFEPQYTSASGTTSNQQHTRTAVDNNNPNDSIGTLVTNLTSSGDQQQQQASEFDRLGYNPQPHSQFNRFNQNI